MVKNVAVVSLSSGTIGEPFAKHELDIGVKRLEDFGLTKLQKQCKNNTDKKDYEESNYIDMFYVLVNLIGSSYWY